MFAYGGTMFAYIKGTIEEKWNTHIVIEAGGIGYKIFMPSSAIQKLPEIGETIKINTYYYVREDNISLYGFITKEELKMFELLLSVSGIGAKSALTMLSEITPSRFALAVVSNDVSNLTKIPGIGTKTAARIVLELKDKLKTEQAIQKNEKAEEIIVRGDNQTEAISALQVLGYAKKEIEKAFEKINTNNLSVEDIIRKALIVLAK